MQKCVELVECDSDVLNDEDRTDELLDVVVLKTCGQLVFDLFRRFRDDDATSSTTTDHSGGSSSSSSSTGSSDGPGTYHEAMMARAFDGLYDVMSRDMEKVDRRYQAPPRLLLYRELSDFVLHYRLHRINRYVFGNAPSQDWGPCTTEALTTVRAWRQKLSDETKVTDGLMKAYKVAASDKEMHPFSVAMVAFAVFGFLLGYDIDNTIDYNILFMFRNIEDVYEPPTFQQVHNSVLRHARLFLEDYASDEDKTLFEALAENADIVALFNWIFDLLSEHPEAVDKFTGNPFPDDQIEDVNGKKMAPSYVIKLRIFYRWVLMELFDLLRGRLRSRMSLLDYQVKECLCCLSETSWLRLFENAYEFALKHFAAILGEYDCPEHLLQTFRVMCIDEWLKDIIMFCVSKQVDNNTYLKHRDSSTDSNESLGSYD